MASKYLPPAEAQYLQSLYSANDMRALRVRTRCLRDAGWTLSSIGAPINAPRSTVRSWENHPDAEQQKHIAENQPPLPTPPGLRPAPSFSPDDTEHRSHSRPRVRAFAIDVPEHDADRIRQLAPLARRVRGGTPPSSPYRQAKHDLNTLLLMYADRGVPVQRLASLAGVTYRAMKVRLEEHRKETTAYARPHAV